MLLPLFFSAFCFIVDGTKFKEVVFGISGSEEFGGHTRKSLYHPSIKKTISTITRQFNRETSKFGAVWGESFQENKTWINEWTIISQLTNDQNKFESNVKQFLRRTSRAPMSMMSGVGGSLEFATHNIFSSENKTYRIFVLLAHREILRKEIQDFFGNRCNPITVYAIIYPWNFENCTNKKTKQILSTFNSYLNWTTFLQHKMAICGRDEKSLKLMAQHVNEVEHVTARVMHFCRWRSDNIVRNMLFTASNASQYFHLPCESYKDLSLVKMECKSNSNKCQSLWCNPLFILGLVSGSVITVGLFLALVTILHVIVTRSKNSSAIRSLLDEQRAFLRSRVSNDDSVVKQELDAAFFGRQDLTKRRATLVAMHRIGESSSAPPQPRHPSLPSRKISRMSNSTIQTSDNSIEENSRISSPSPHSTSHRAFSDTSAKIVDHVNSSDLCAPIYDLPRKSSDGQSQSRHTSQSSTSRRTHHKISMQIHSLDIPANTLSGSMSDISVNLPHSSHRKSKHDIETPILNNFDSVISKPLEKVSKASANVYQRYYTPNDGSSRRRCNQESAKNKAKRRKSHTLLLNLD